MGPAVLGRVQRSGKAHGNGGGTGKDGEALVKLDQIRQRRKGPLADGPLLPVGGDLEVLDLIQCMDLPPKKASKQTKERTKIIIKKMDEEEQSRTAKEMAPSTYVR
jgi:hypothetical protein